MGSRKEVTAVDTEKKREMPKVLLTKNTTGYYACLHSVHFAMRYLSLFLPTIPRLYSHSRLARPLLGRVLDPANG